MKTFKLFINDRGKYHFGDSRDELADHFSSDQLFSALINNMVLLYGSDVVDNTVSIFENGEAKFTSIYYGLDIIERDTGELKKTLYFLPKPICGISLNNMEGSEIWAAKRIKRIEYISAGAFDRLLASWDEDKRNFAFDLLGLPTIDVKFGYMKEELHGLDVNVEELEGLKFIKQNSRPRVAINRNSNKSNVFYYQEYLEVCRAEVNSYRIEPFMYFLFDGSLTKELKASISLLADEGIGGMRSMGMGYFTHIEESDEKQFDNFRDNGRYYVSLSACYPGQEETAGIMNYELHKKNGYIFSGGRQLFRKRSIRVLKEGSIFNMPVSGQIIELTPQGFDKHRIYFCGKSFLIGFGGGR
ncbi:MAG: hypothetical protein HPY66_2974 [Firmicutes bacterium]|nr:hypothetical protein [Bacillota bacterium]